MTAILVSINTTVFVVISMLHVYWALGGKYGSVVTLPSRPDGQLLFKPGTISTMFIAVGLLIFAFITITNLPDFEHWLDVRATRYGTWVIAAIFIVRAIGDFKYVGFFKQITDTRFARNDARIYSPLSFTMGLISLMIAILD